MNVFKTALFLSVLMFIVGCGTSSPTPTLEQSLKPTPKWVTSVLPTDDSQFLYGMSVAKNRDSAIKDALNDVISRLGISIESSFESIEKVQGSYVDSRVNSSIKADVAKIKINNYKVIKSYKLNYREFAVMVAIDKQKFIRGLEDDLNSKKNAILRASKSAASLDAIQRYNLRKNLAKKSAKLLSVIYILSELEGSFDKVKNVEFVSLQQKKFLQEKKKLQFFVSGNVKSQKFVNKIKNYLANLGLRVAHSKANAVKIEIYTKDNINNNYISIAVLSVNIKVFDTSRRVGGKEIIIKERYNNSIEGVYKNAAIHFEQDIQNQGINKLIGINLNLE